MQDPTQAVTRVRLPPVTEAAALDELIARSHQEPVLLFNYDPFCPINATARQELERLGADAVAADATARMVQLAFVPVVRVTARALTPGVRPERDGAVDDRLRAMVRGRLERADG